MSPWEQHVVRLVPWDHLGDVLQSIEYMHFEDPEDEKFSVAWLAINTIIEDTYDIGSDVSYTTKVSQSIVMEGSMAAPSITFDYEATAHLGLHYLE